MEQPVSGIATRATPRFRCPLGHEHTSIVEAVPLDQLEPAWKQRFNIDVHRLFGDVADRRLWFCRCHDCHLRFFAPLVAGDGAFYNGLSDWYDQWSGHVADAEFKPDYQVALGHIRSGSSVLEIGSGCARFDRHLPANTSYVGLELNPQYAQRAQAAGVDVRLESIEDHALRHAGSYDVVCLFQVIEHIASLQSFLAAVVACVRPGGVLTIGCPNADGFLGAESDNLLNMPPHHVTWWSRPALGFIAQTHGLDVIEIIEEPLEELYRKSFARSVWLRRLGGGQTADRQFCLTGSRYRAASFAAGALSRLTMGFLAGFEGCIKGHTITGVFRKPV